MARGAGGVKGLVRISVSCCFAVWSSSGLAGLLRTASSIAMPSLASVFLMLELLAMMAW